MDTIVGTKKRGRRLKPMEEKATSDLKAYHRDYHWKRSPEYLLKQEEKDSCY